MKANSPDEFLGQVQGALIDRALVIAIMISPDEDEPDEGAARLNLRVIANTANDAMVLEGLAQALAASTDAAARKYGVPEQIVVPPNGKSMIYLDRPDVRDA